MSNKTSAPRSQRREPAYLLAGTCMLVVIVTLVVLAITSFRGGFESHRLLVVESDRAGLVMDPGAKVKMRGVTIGSVASMDIVDGNVALELDIDPASFGEIPANVSAEIKASTAFGSKYVALVPPEKPSLQTIQVGQQIKSSNVTTEVNTLFENLNGVMTAIDPAKLNAILGAVSSALRQRGTELGETITNANQLFSQVNPTMGQLENDFRLGAEVTNTYAGAADDLLALLDNATVTSRTVVDEQKNLDGMLTSLIGLGTSGSELLRTSGSSFVDASRLLVPTTELLAEYSPEYKCLMDQSVYNLDYGIGQAFGNGYSLGVDVALLFGDNAYTYPENLPKVAASGGPGGAPGCYSQITENNYPAPYLVMDTGVSTADATKLEAGAPLFIQYLVGNVAGGN